MSKESKWMFVVVQSDSRLFSVEGKLITLKESDIFECGHGIAGCQTFLMTDGIWGL